MMNMSIMGSTLYIKLDRDGVIQNMQNDASAFEGWVFCLRMFFCDINNVIIDWDNPTFSSDEKVSNNQQKHYNRFLLRVLWFIENYSWVALSAEKIRVIDDFKHSISQFTLNYPLQSSKDKSEKGDTDRRMKYEAMLETAIYQYLLKKGLKDNGKFVLVSPKQLMQPLNETHQDLYNYLETRYWQ